MNIRKAKKEDLKQLKEIHNDYIQNSTALWINDMRDDAFMERWFEEHGAKNRPLIVAYEENEIIGYACLSTFRNNEGWGNLVEDSIYVKKGFYDKGVGHKLMEEMIRLGKSAGIWGITAWIDTENSGSIKFHQAFGFETKMVYENLGEKFGEKRSSAVMLLELRD